MPLNRDPEAVILGDPRLVGAAGHVAPPVLLVKVPANGLFKSAAEFDAAALAELAGEFGGVNRVAVIVTGAVGHITDQ